MCYSIVSLLALVLMLSAAPAFPSYGGNMDIEIISDNGGVSSRIPHKNYSTGGTQIIKSYLEARKGENYSILIRNNTPDRVGVVIAVDGRNIITGKKSFLNNSEMMYIVAPYNTAKLEGWRTDQNTVHRFYFTDVKDSYSVKTFGDSSAMGVIAVSAFREKERPELLYDRKPLKDNAPAPSAGAQAKESAKRYESDAAGTGFGDEKFAPVTKVEFEPESVPFKKMLVKYEWRETLCRKGLLKCYSEKRNRLWDEAEFAPYPPGYGYR